MIPRERACGTQPTVPRVSHPVDSHFEAIWGAAHGGPAVIASTSPLAARNCLALFVICQLFAQRVPKASGLRVRNCDSNASISVERRSRVTSTAKGDSNAPCSRISVRIWLSGRGDADVAHSQTVSAGWVD